MNGMSKWEKRLWLVLAIGSSLGVAFHFGSAAIDKLEAIRVIGEKSFVKVENAGRIVEETKPAVMRAADNSDAIVTHSQKALEEVAALKEWRDSFEQEMRDRMDRFEWHLYHPFDAILGRKPKKGERR